MSLFLLCALLFGSPLIPETEPAAVPASASSLKDWVNGPVSVVISEVEKKTFAQLPTDVERQHFIDAFWSSRNDIPNGGNKFKEEFEKRVETADTLFGRGAGIEGWRTERGRFYILLGPPSSRAQYKGYGELRPIDLWFYSGKHEYPQLPSFFYLMFYQRDDVGDYRRYSPFIDQPRSLVTARIRDNKDAYSVLSHINSELARASMSLLPSEPLDLQDFMPSMSSDAVLAQINQIPRRDFERAGFLKELVRVKLKFGGTTTMTMYPFTTSPGVFAVDLAIDRPEGIGDAQVETVVRSDGNEVGRTQGTFAKGDPLIGRLVLKPGDYEVEATVADTAGTQRFVAKDVLHLKASANTLAMSDVLFFQSAKPAGAGSQGSPFTYRGYQFAAETDKQFHPADKFQVLFEITAPHLTPGADKKISIDYTVAALNNPTHRWNFHDEVGLDRLDSSGLLFNSKTLPIRDVPPGRYFLIILVKDPAGRRASQTVSFEVTDISVSQK
jgi:GWxTD domain-containing protein